MNRLFSTKFYDETLMKLMNTTHFEQCFCQFQSKPSICEENLLQNNPCVENLGAHVAGTRILYDKNF